MTFDDMYHTKIYRIRQEMKLQEIERLERYLIAKNKSGEVLEILEKIEKGEIKSLKKNKTK